MNIDIFNNNAFSMVEMTKAINLLPYKPGRVGQLNLFAQQGVATTSVEIEFKDGQLGLIPTRDRNEPTNFSTSTKRKVRNFRVPHIPLDDYIFPQDIQNVRAFGSSTELATAATMANEKLQTMVNKHVVTHEYHMLGALKGIVLDADGTTVVYNLFTEFGVSQPTVDFDLTEPTANIRGACEEVLTAVETALGGAAYDHVHAFCGANFFSKLVDHAQVKEAWKRYNDGEMLRTDLRYKGFMFGDIIWEVYRGKVGTIDFVDTDEAQFFPVGVPDGYLRYNAPGNLIDAANTIGLPYYAMQEPLPMGKGLQIHTESNPLFIATRPGTLVNGTITP